MSSAATASASAGEPTAQRVLARAVAATAIGNFIEIFDFAIYGMFARQIAANFFTSADPVLALLSAFAVYGVGFAARPLGAIVIGNYGDRHGRRAALVLTVLVMAIATGLTGLVPPMSRIGLWAPALLVLLRLVQGFSTGGEWGGAASFLVEHAPPGRRGLIGSLHQASAVLALMVTTLLAAALNAYLSKASMNMWGWRLPFLAGFVLAPVGLYLRSKVLETPAFERVARERTLVECSPLGEAIRDHRIPILTAFGVAAVGTVANYTFMVYFPTFGIRHLGIPAGTAFYGTAAAAGLVACLAPLSGMLSDRIGRKPLMLAPAIGFVVLVWPIFHFAIDTRSEAGFITAQLVAAFMLGISAGPYVPILAELFPTRVRFTALSIGYSLSVSLFGGFAPFIDTLLTQWTGRLDAPALYVAAVGLVTTATLLSVAEPLNRPLG